MSNEFRIVPVPLLNEVLQYLSSRPYAEVYNLISAIMATPAPPETQEPAA